MHILPSPYNSSNKKEYTPAYKSRWWIWGKVSIWGNKIKFFKRDVREFSNRIFSNVLSSLDPVCASDECRKQDINLWISFFLHPPLPIFPMGYTGTLLFNPPTNHPSNTDSHVNIYYHTFTFQHSQCSDKRVECIVREGNLFYRQVIFWLFFCCLVYADIFFCALWPTYRKK